MVETGRTDCADRSRHLALGDSGCEIDSEGPQCLRVGIDAPPAQDFEHVLLSGLAEGEPIQGDIPLHPVVSIQVVAEWERRHMALNPARSGIDPTRGKIAKLVLVVGGQVVQPIPWVAVGPR